MDAKSLVGPAICIAGLSLATPSFAQPDRVWINGTDGDWMDAARWSPADVPNTSSENAVITAPGSYTVQLGASSEVGLLTLANGRLTMVAGNALGVASGIGNDSLFTLNPSAGTPNTHVLLRGTWDISGSGRISLNANAGNLNSAGIHPATGPETFTNGAAHTIGGSGNISAAALNYGTITADLAGRTLALSGQPKTNNGTFSAMGGGQLLVQVAVGQGTSGLTRAGDGSGVVFQNGSVTGGTLESQGTGLVEATGYSTFTGMTNSARVEVRAGQVLTLSGSTIGNSGSILVNPSASTPETWLRLGSNPLEVAGAGQIILNAHASNLGSSQIVSQTGTEAMINGPQHTIRGTGAIHSPLTNNGTVLADQLGRTLQLYGNAKVNNGLMKSAQGGVLLVNAPVSQGASGRIVAESATVDFQSATLTSGVLETTGTGIARVTANSEFSGITSNADVQVLVGTVLNLGGSGLANNGSVAVNPTGASPDTWLRAKDATTTLSGTGQVILNANATNLNSAAMVALTGPETFVNSATHTIRGTGNVSAPLVNEGQVFADQPGRYLLLSGAGKTNNSVLRASDGAVLRVQSPLAQGTNGRLIASDSLIELHGSTLTGGRLEASGTGLSRVTLSSTLTGVTNAGPLEVNNGQVLSIAGTGLTNNGTLVVNPTGASTDTWLRANSATTTLPGSGEIVLNAHASNLNSAAMVSLTGPEAFVNTAAHTIRGTGNISAALINEGTVFAEQNGRTLLLSGSPKSNNAMMGARAGGILHINAAVTQAASGVIRVEDGGVTLQGGGISGGRLEASGAGVIGVNTSGSLGNLSNAATVHVLHATTLRLDGPVIVNSGTLLVNPSGASPDTLVRLSGNLELIGSGQLVLNAYANNPNSAAIGGTTGAEVLTNGSAHLIRGNGLVGVRLENQGRLAPGLDGSAGKISGSTSVMSNTATGEMDFDLFTPSSFDRVVTAGPINLGGKLVVQLAPGYVTGSGAMMPVIQGTSIVGTFGSHDLPGRMRPIYSTTQVKIFDPCTADLADTSGAGIPDGGVTIDDLLYFLGAFEAGGPAADVDDGSMTGTPDQGVTIDDLLYYLARFEAGC